MPGEEIVTSYGDGYWAENGDILLNDQKDYLRVQGAINQRMASFLINHGVTLPMKPPTDIEEIGRFLPKPIPYETKSSHPPLPAQLLSINDKNGSDIEFLTKRHGSDGEMKYLIRWKPNPNLLPYWCPQSHLPAHYQPHTSDADACMGVEQRNKQTDATRLTTSKPQSPSLTSPQVTMSPSLAPPCCSTSPCSSSSSFSSSSPPSSACEGNGDIDACSEDRDRDPAKVGDGDEHHAHRRVGLDPEACDILSHLLQWPQVDLRRLLTDMQSNAAATHISPERANALTKEEMARICMKAFK